MATITKKERAESQIKTLVAEITAARQEAKATNNQQAKTRLYLLANQKDATLQKLYSKYAATYLQPRFAEVTKEKKQRLRDVLTTVSDLASDARASGYGREIAEALLYLQANNPQLYRRAKAPFLTLSGFLSDIIGDADFIDNYLETVI